MGQNKYGKLRLIGKFLKGSAHFFALSIISALLVSLFELICPKIISFTVDSVIGSVTPDLPVFINPELINIAYLRSHLWVIAAVIMGFAVLMGIFKLLQSVWNRCGAETLVETMRNTLYSHISRLPFSWYMKNQTGDIIQRCTSDVETVKVFLSEQLTSVISTTLLIVLSLCFMLTINGKLAVIAIVTIPVILLYSAFFHKRIGSGFEKCDENEGQLSAICQENLTGVRVVRAFGREKYEVDKFAAQNKIYTDSWVRLCRLMSAFWSTGDLISGLQVMLIIIFGVVLCIRGEMTAGDFIAAVSYNAMLIWPVRQLGRVISEMSKAGISIGRIGYILDSEQEHDAENAVPCDMSGDIKFSHVSFSYDGAEDTKVLDDVSLKIEKGKTLGILGMTGSGKSTLVQLLCRLYEPTEGKITVSGRNIREIQSESLRKSIGIVLQEPFLFSRTLKANIGIIDEEPDMENVKKAAAIACLDDTIEGFANGYDTMVGERGVTLSGGQKQRTAIARTLYQNTPVMIFDDSLSAVDAETDAKIRHALRDRLNDATVIIISHRISTLMSADKIIVMNHGKIVEAGTHEELLAQNGLYKQINDIQTSGDIHEE